MKGWIIGWLLLWTVTGWSKTALDVAPDCSEDKISIQKLLEIGNSPQTSSMLDFLRAIPPKSLQTFTFVHSSNSLQHHLVDKKWPRVLRMSADGKLTLSFVCNPESQDYGRVEVLHYVDPPVAEWRAISFDFRTKKSSVGPLTEEQLYSDLHKTRVKHNEKACANCHSPTGEYKAGLRLKAGSVGL